MPLLHERRRRLISDDSSSTDDEPQLRLAAEGGDALNADGHGLTSRRYAADTPLDRGQRLHELFPAGYLTIALVMIGGLTAVAALELLHVWTQSLTKSLVFTSEEIAALDLSVPGNASGWFAAMLLGLASLVATFIYSLRRHRLDDYHGRYRVWLWAAAGCLLASLGETTTVGTLGKGLCHRVAEACGLVDSVIWPAVLTIPLAALVVRLLIEVWRCRLAAIALVVAAGGWLFAMAVDYGWIVVVSADTGPLVERGSWLTAYVLAVTALLLYTRHVMREIAGLIAAPPVKIKRRKRKHAPTDAPAIAADPAPKQRPAGRSDLEPVRSPAVSATASRPHSAGGPQSVTRHDSAHVEVEPDRHLSRAERRRLRREARRSA